MGELQLAEQQLLGVVNLSGALQDDATGGGEDNRKLRLQLYVFVLRCISYPFNAKQTSAGDHRQQLLKLRKPQLEQIVQQHSRFLRTAHWSAASGSMASPDRGDSGAPATPTTTGVEQRPSFQCQYQHLKLTQSQTRQLDELCELSQVTFNRKFLQNERMHLLVESECCSQQDLRDLFRQNAERILNESQLFQAAQQQARAFLGRQSAANFGRPDPGGGGGFTGGSGGQAREESASVLAANQLLASKEAILKAWLVRFEAIIRGDGEPTSGGSSISTFMATSSAGAARGDAPSTPTIITTTTPAAATTTSQGGQMSKEQLYQMFQNILTIKKFEHQLLYNALQLDSSDEQAAAIRRELDGRVARIAELERNSRKLLPKFVLKEMESLYLEEARMAVNKLMVNLDSLPVLKGAPSESRGGVYGGLQKFRRYNSR